MAEETFDEPMKIVTYLDQHKVDDEVKGYDEVVTQLKNKIKQLLVPFHSKLKSNGHAWTLTLQYLKFGGSGVIPQQVAFQITGQDREWVFFSCTGTKTNTVKFITSLPPVPAAAAGAGQRGARPGIGTNRT